MLVALSSAQRAVLFDSADMRSFALLDPDNSTSSTAYLFFTPLGNLTFRPSGLPSLATTHSTSRGRFSGITAPLRRIDRLPPSADALAIDVEYAFTLNDSTERLATIGHGTNQLLLLSSDEDTPADPRGLVFEYGGGNLLPADFSAANWSEPRMAAWRFDAVQSNGIGGPPGYLHLSAARRLLVRAGRFRLRARYILHPNATLEFQQFSMSVENNVNFTGLLIHADPDWSQFMVINASRWLQRNSSNAPRISLFSTRTDFDVENLVITAEPLAGAPSFNSTWLSPPPTPAPITTTTARPTPVPTPLPTPVPSSSSGLVTMPAPSPGPTPKPAATLTLAPPTSGATNHSESLSGSSSATTISSMQSASGNALTGGLSTESSSTTGAAGSFAPANSDGLEQKATIAVAVVVPTIFLCFALVYIARRKCAKRASAHAPAQVLSTSKHKVRGADADKEFRSMREMDSIYGAGPPKRGGDYDVVCDDDLMPSTELHGWRAHYSPAPGPPSSAPTMTVCDVATSNSIPIYDRVAPLPAGIYEDAASKLNV